MKNTILIIFTSLIFSGMSAQDEETIAISEDACECMGEVDLSLPKEKQYEKIKSCITASIFSYQLQQTLTSLPESLSDTIVSSENTEGVDSISPKKEFNIVITADKNYNVIEEYSLRNCYAMQQIMASNNDVSESSISDKKKAKAFYDKGQQYFAQEKYGNAIVEYSKAVKKDKKFAFAWDMLGYSYKRQNQFKQAIESYNKSLEIDPKGKMPLMNKPIAYAMLEDYDNAIKSYNDMIAFYPEDAEGYYGIGRMYHLKGDYENAVESMMNAYIKYNSVDSPYARDAESNLALFYKELEEKDQLEIFERLSKKYNIKIKE